MVIDTLREKKQAIKENAGHTLSKTDENGEQHDDELICLKTVQLMTFILLSTSAHDRKMTD